MKSDTIALLCQFSSFAPLLNSTMNFSLLLPPLPDINIVWKWNVRSFIFI